MCGNVEIEEQNSSAEALNIEKIVRRNITKILSGQHMMYVLTSRYDLTNVRMSTEMHDWIKKYGHIDYLHDMRIIEDNTMKLNTAQLSRDGLDFYIGVNLVSILSD